VYSKLAKTNYYCAYLNLANLGIEDSLIATKFNAAMDIRDYFVSAAVQSCKQKQFRMVISLARVKSIVELLYFVLRTPSERVLKYAPSLRPRLRRC